MSKMPSTGIDAHAANAAKVFLERVSERFPVDHAILFGSGAQHTHRPDSDADLAVIINEQSGNRSEAAIAMAGIAFDVMLDTHRHSCTSFALVARRVGTPGVIE